MLWSAQRLVSRPTRKSRPANVPLSRTTPRRPLLQVDCLEDRFAPAAIVLLGQPEVVVSSVSIVNFTAPAPTVLTSVNAPVSSASTVGAFATFDEIPFGFFHPFAQAGVIGEEIHSIEPPLAGPPAVLPPVLPEPMNALPLPTDAPPALPAPGALPAIPQIEALPVPMRTPAVDPKPSLLELSRMNEVEPAAIDRVWEEVFKPAAAFDPLELTTGDAPESPTLGAALAALSLLSLRPTTIRRDRALALALES